MSFDLVLFGGTGDLTWRKLMPALFQAFRHGKLPPGGRIVAVARDERSDEQYRAFIRDRFAAVEEAKQPSAEDSSASPGCCTTGAWTSPSPRTTRR
jgi:glucose-6-phosphate 1-dehydrogenase